MTSAVKQSQERYKPQTESTNTEEQLDQNHGTKTTDTIEALSNGQDLFENEQYKNHKQFSSCRVETICQNCKQLFFSKNKLHNHLQTKCPQRKATGSKDLKKVYSVTRLATRTSVPAPSHASPTPTSILQATFSTFTSPTTPSASTSATPKLSHAAIAGSRTPPTTLTTSKIPLSSPALAALASSHAFLTPPTTSKIAKPTCAISKPIAYMTIDDLFWKFASRTTQHQHATKLRPQCLQLPLPSPTSRQATVVCFSAISSAFKNALNQAKQHLIQLISASPQPLSVRTFLCLQPLPALLLPVRRFLCGNRPSNLDYGWEHGLCSRQKKNLGKKKIKTYTKQQKSWKTSQQGHSFFSFWGR